MDISLTSQAISEVRRMMEKENKQGTGLRMGVKGGGGSGL